MNTKQTDKNIFMYKLTMIMNTKQTNRQTKTFLCITLTFIKSSKKFYYVQAAEIIKPKMLSKGITSSNHDKFSQFSQVFKMESEDKLT